MLTLNLRLTVIALLMVFAVVEREHIAVAQSGNSPERMPVFEVDAAWPKIPNEWALGVVSSVATDRRDHVWILHRPRTVPENLKAKAAPPVLEFDAGGRFVRAWGGPATGYDWPVTEHGIIVDHRDNIWIGGSGITDDMLLKFTNEGKFISQIGARGQSKGNADTKNVNRPADLFVHPATNEAYVADGYGNRRVIVFDAAKGAFKRMWGAFGNAPDNDPPAGAPAAAELRGARRDHRLRRSSTPKDPVHRASPIRCTPSRFRTTASCMWPIDRIAESRFSPLTEST